MTGGGGGTGIAGGCGLKGGVTTGGTTGMADGAGEGTKAGGTGTGLCVAAEGWVGEASLWTLARPPIASVSLMACRSPARQRAVGLAQLQVAQQHVVARQREVALGLEQLALRIEHVDVDAHAHLVAQPVGVQRALARGFGRFQRLHLALARDQAEVGRARGLRDAAAGRFEVGARLFLQRQRFA